MKIGTGEGQGMFGRMKEMWKATDFDAMDAERQANQAQKAEADRQATFDAQKAKYEQSQSPEAQEAREAKINEQIESLDRIGENRTNEEVAQFLRTTNTDTENNSIRAEAYARWKEKRARQAVEAARGTTEQEDELAARRKVKEDEQAA